MTAVISTVSATTANQADVMPATSAFIAGLALIFLVGFAPMPEVHNVAHDTRHSAAFPCH